MRIEDLNWFDAEDYLKQEDRLMLILGACEQHGYLSLACDIKIPQALADAASKKTEILVAPPVNFGCSQYFADYPGTFTLRLSTLSAIVEDLVRSAYHQGFKRILILNGHGGNDGVRTRLQELVAELPEMKIRWYAWWVAPSVIQVAEKHGLTPYHAAWSEAFPFTRVAELPQGEKKPATAPWIMDPEKARQVYGDGVFGGRYQVEDAIMDEIFDACLKDILELLRFEE